MRVLARACCNARDREEEEIVRRQEVGGVWQWRTLIGIQHVAARGSDGGKRVAPRAWSRSERAGLGESCKSRQWHPALTSFCTSASSTARASRRSYSCSSSPVSMVVVTEATPSAPSAPGARTAAWLQRRRAPVAPTTNRTLRRAGPSGTRQPVLTSDAHARVRSCARPWACPPPPDPSSSWFLSLCVPAAAARGGRERKRRRRRCGASDTASTTPGSATDCAASRPGANTVATSPAPRGSAGSGCDARGDEGARRATCHLPRTDLVARDERRARCGRRAAGSSRGRD